jgi:hypothetical protein
MGEGFLMNVRNWLKAISALFVIVFLAGCSPLVNLSNATNATNNPSPSNTSSIRGNTIISLNTTNETNKALINDNPIGLSFELSEVCEILSLDAQNPTRYEQFYKNLGNGVMHVGGHSSELGVWSPYGSPYCSSSHTVVTRSMISAFFAFVARIHWQVIWGLNLIRYNPQAAANEASYVASAAGSSLTAFNIGNEPDLYAKHGFRPANWGYANYIAEWNAYYTAVHQLVPAAKFIGSDACCESPLFYNFVQDESGKIIAATHHFYAGQVIYGSGQNADIPYLLSTYLEGQQAEYLSRWRAVAQQAGVPLEITESNTFSNGGIAGVSNTYAAALWATDFLCEAASLGVQSIEFQNSRQALYNAIDDNGNPTPLYYGLLFFHALTQSSNYTVTSVNLQTSLNVTAYKVTDVDGKLHLIVINKDLDQNATVGIQLSASATKAQVLRLTAPSLDATSQVSLGGAMLSSQGTWSPTNLETISVQGNVAYVTVPKGSAAELTFA